ncbi:Tubulin-tyrosine ligase family protein [Entamoeba histolytica HM-1:IMSS-B]|uniref:Tubulin--tyrosine ligase-like protein 12 SET-like domain-containing protein n=6 Tax=Entamoeba histolytica TaxID=5759 RepID=C4M2T0_ENTH1|nr:hypothetical protein, conserved [Entamoeba histolytica HM-1:IMSS]EMD43747.1 tubulintyrosine ligase family protein [Entamoeba histolytica KU27]EMH73981.1 Tubulin-tyrosine ligase family protein [Entamoeba histolytica HM-1:IMSS-B]EMS12268.1 Tubulin-tyrosine ligase family protein [Entamoeba histolytica HM-3:IMSS]ENY60429.1 Tubulin-tyrosine ligase family protein, putative [Entamoeba histolytica HM-1:IMSS-A]GAT95598.1 hypothetical protein conserved [Entamoeba histolytica]|eukprot:XP_654938.1 hypothetical protein, conserved [Entamoeba histolytica HM-1:IMSS]
MQDITTAAVFFMQSHQEQFKRLGIPSNLIIPLYHKLVEQTFDAGKVFQFCEMPEGIVPENGRKSPFGLLCIKEEGIEANSDIFLIEHHFTAEREDAMMAIAKNPQILVEYEELFGLNSDDADPATRLQRFYDLMWEYNFSLRLRSEEENKEKCLWYLLDNVGISIIYSKTPNCKLIPFYFIPTETFYTLLLPIQKIEYAEMISCDYLTPLQLLPDEYTAIPLRNRFIEAQEVVDEMIKSYEKKEIIEENKLVESYQIKQQEYISSPSKIYSQNDLIKKYLTISPFEHTEIINESDGIFLLNSLEDEEIEMFKGTSVYIDQFEGENSLTINKELYHTLKLAYGKEYIKIIPETFDFSNLEEVKEFVITYFKREKEGMDNYWIIKPITRTEGNRNGIFNNINAIIKIANSIPCIISKYIIEPLLINERKFELRFIVLMKYDVMWKSQKPDIYLYDRFWSHFTTNTFNLDDLNDYERHFTSKKYGNKINTMGDIDFIKQFNEKYGEECKWENLKEKIEILISRTFDAGIQTHKYKFEVNSCAIYGVDVMVDSHFNPILHQIKFQPDCTDACEDDNEFYNKIFTCFFKEQCNAKQIY